MDPRERKSLYKLIRLANPEGRFGFLRLDKNERLNPVSKKFLAQYKKLLSAESISIYPEIEQVRKATADYAGLSAQQIFLAHGSDAAIKQVFEVFAREGSKVVLLSPTYAMYEVYIAMFGARAVGIECDDEFKIDEKKLLAQIDKNSSIVVIANPNSPTGSKFDRAFLLNCLKKCQSQGAVLLIDEAYYPFSSTTMMPAVKENSNLVVTRSFSKAFGLAGCRAGFMAASNNLLESLAKARPLYEINALSGLAIMVCLNNLSEVKKYLRQLENGKRYLIKECLKLGLKPYPTWANFINIRLLGNWNTGCLEDFARKKGVLLKGRLDQPCFQNCIRVTLGPKKDMAKLVAVLKAFIGGK